MAATSVLVTGASGFIGAHCVRQLAAAGYRVTATGRDRDRLAALPAGIRVLPADLAADALAPLLAGQDAVVHAAALSAPWGPRAAFQRHNVLATQALMRAARLAGVARVVFLGSPSIYYRPQDQLDVPEAFLPPARWITPYAESKWMAEEAVRGASGAGLTSVVLRPRAVFGDGDTAIFPRLLARARSGRFPLVAGGRAVIDATHVDNVVDAVASALVLEVAGASETFNISNGEPMRVRTLLETLFQAAGLDVRYRSVPRPMAMGVAGLVETAAKHWPGAPEPPVSRYMLGVLAYSQTLDLRAARSRLRYAPRTPLVDGITRFAAQWRRQ